MSYDLVHISYSPWSERARWVLDHAGIPWRSQPYTPTLSEPALRVRLRDFTGPITIPVLFTPDGPVRDSWDIAEFAARQTPGLLPDGTVRINTLADDALRSGRGLAGRRVLRSPDAIAASRPALAKVLGKVGSVLTADGWKRVMKKYREPGMSDDDHRARQHDRLSALREAVGDGPFVFDTFSYADITAASALAFVKPHARLGLAEPAAAAWTDPALVEEFADLLQWRDALILEHRFAPHPRPTGASR